MSRIVKIGSYLPSIQMTNDALIKHYKLESDHEWIKQRTGIEHRYFGSSEETVSFMAYKAVENLLSELNEDIREDIRLIIVASMSSKLPTPSIANQVQTMIGATKAWGFDINGACSAFVMAMDIAEKFANQYNEGYTLVIGTEKMSDILNFSDRGSCILFGDGSGAFLIKNDGQSFKNFRSELHTAPDEHDAIVVKQSNDLKMTMQGREVFNFVSRTVIKSLRNFVAEDTTQSEYIICHQANQRLLDIITKKLDVDSCIVPSNIQSVANLSAASIPVLCHELVKKNKLRLDETQHVTICGFGGGLAWGQLSLTI